MLFVQRLESLPHVDNKPIQIITSSVITVGSENLIFGSQAIIDDILLWCSVKSLLLLYFECVCKVFVKYRVSFKLPKCCFLADRVEFVGHDLLCNGNAPASSKFNLIKNWSLPMSGQFLFSFIGLIAFYHKFAPYHEITHYGI